MNKKVLAIIACAGLMSTLLAGTDSDTTAEENRLGGGGSIGVGVMWLDLDPLKSVVQEDLNRSGFEFDNNKFITLSMTGYCGNRKNGFKIGYSGLVGYNTLYSDPWTSKSKDSSYVVNHPDSLVDSVVQLHNVLVHGGLLLERNFNILKNCNLYAGTMIGGGILLSYADQRLAKSAFRRVDSHDDVDDNNDKDKNHTYSDTLEEDKVAVAPLWAFDVHGGFAYSLTTWMHVALDASATMYYSSVGFSYRHGSFMSVNPGLKIRLIFGNAV